MPRFIPNTGLGAIALEHRVQRLEHEAVAAERDQRLGLVGVGASCSGGGASLRPPRRRRCATTAGRCRALARSIAARRGRWRVSVQPATPRQSRLAQDKAFRAQASLSRFGARLEAALPAGGPGVSRMRHVEMGQRIRVGQAGVGSQGPPPAFPTRDRLLEAAIAHEQIERPLPAADRARQRPDRRRRSAGALGRSRDRRGVVRPRRGRRARRAAVAARSSARRCAAPRRGRARSQDLEPVDQPAAARTSTRAGL